VDIVIKILCSFDDLSCLVNPSVTVFCEHVLVAIMMALNRRRCALSIFSLLVLILHVLAIQSNARILPREDHAQEVIGVADFYVVNWTNG
jgi:hypothetical protein